MSDDITVAVQNLSKSYFLTPSGSNIGFSSPARRTEVEALKRVSLAACTGESIGVLGKNGSGKSTLLRIIAGSESPTRGKVLVSAQPTLLGVSAALQPDLPGRSNVKLGLLAMGLSPQEVAELEEDVISWANLEDSIDLPMNTYSSGMQARLRFSISTAVRAEILLVDEALSTGDSTFAAKAKKRMDSFLDSAGTVFLVSHGATTIQEYCSRAIWLHEGEVIADGNAQSVAKSYRVWGNRVANGKLDEAEGILADKRASYDPPQIVFDSQAAAALDS